MTAFWTLLAVAAVVAVVDWIAVARDDARLEYVAKPGVLLALIAACAVLPDGHTDLVDRKWWFVAALVLCLLGDVVLMVPKDLFVAGLGTFLVGHLLYIGGFLQAPSPPGHPPFEFSSTGLVVAGLAAVAYAAVPATLLVRALWRDGRRGLLPPVAGPSCAWATR